MARDWDLGGNGTNCARRLPRIVGVEAVEELEDFSQACTG